ncbi:hypothetical protein LguiA_001753 [Lonicera macranthoides]
MTIDNEEKDFMDVILSTLKGVSHQELGGFDVDIVAKSTCLVYNASRSRRYYNSDADMGSLFTTQQQEYVENGTRRA